MDTLPRSKHGSQKSVLPKKDRIDRADVSCNNFSFTVPEVSLSIASTPGALEIEFNSQDPDSLPGFRYPTYWPGEVEPDSKDDLW